MLVLFYIVLVVFLYAFIGRCVQKISYKLMHEKFEHDRVEEAAFNGICWPIAIVIFLFVQFCKLPFKLADFICNPDSYKFKIKFEKKVN